MISNVSAGEYHPDIERICKVLNISRTENIVAKVQEAYQALQQVKSLTPLLNPETDQSLTDALKLMLTEHQQMKEHVSSVYSVINLPEEREDDLVETFRSFVVEKDKLQEQLDKKTQKVGKLQTHSQQLTLESQQKDETIEKLRRQLDFFRNELKNANRENRDQ